MPFTPFHFGPHACAAFPADTKIDIPVFILANVAVDIEPLSVIVFNLNYPLHGYAHTFWGAALVGIIWGMIAFKCKSFLKKIMEVLRLPYATTLKKCIVSGIFGALLHVLFDAPLYADIRPLFPFNANPFYGIISENSMYNLCGALFIPAIIFYIHAVRKFKRAKSK